MCDLVQSLTIITNFKRAKVRITRKLKCGGGSHTKVRDHGENNMVKHREKEAEIKERVIFALRKKN